VGRTGDVRTLRRTALFAEATACEHRADVKCAKQQHGQHGFCRAIIAQNQQFVCAGITCRCEIGRAAGDVDGKIEKICQQYLRGESQRRCGQLLRQRHRRARLISVTRRQDDERGDGYQSHRNADGEPFGGERAACAAYKIERHKHAEDYDLAGFAVGVVDKKKILDNTRMSEGDVVIALPSTGIHSNGFSLCRKVFNIDSNDPMLYEPREELGGKTIAEALLVPTRIYVKAILALLEKVDVKGISHITGGGFYENIPRSIPSGLTAKIDRSAVKVLPIFDVIAKVGNIPERDMFNTYNMGVGMSVVVPKGEVDKAIKILKSFGEDAYVIGEIVKGDEGIVIC